MGAGVISDCWLLKEPTVASPPWRFLIQVGLVLLGVGVKCWSEVLISVGVWVLVYGVMVQWCLWVLVCKVWVDIDVCVGGCGWMLVLVLMNIDGCRCC
jgi:hypothetical protein